MVLKETIAIKQEGKEREKRIRLVKRRNRRAEI